MITVRLTGGMGNQMFQYAAGRRLAEKHGVPLSLDTTLLGVNENDTVETIRSYELDRFKIDVQFATEKQIFRFSDRPASIMGRLWRRTAMLLRGEVFYFENGSEFKPEILELGPNVCIMGRFQSEKYFLDIEPIIRQEFRISTNLSESCAALINRVEQCHSVAIHVRRGDYVSNQKYAMLLGPMPVSYYQSAIVALNKQIDGDLQTFVFSDDIAWCKRNLKFLGESAIFVSMDGIDACIEEFRVMQSCNHFIISNSTYAWWAAWLCERSNKIVIAPRNWSSHHEVRSKDRLPEKWTAL